MIQDDNIIVLPDGRRLGYAVYGDPKGKPILFFHGIPGSRLQRPADIGFLQKLGYCVYALDRPGIGVSDRCKHRSWAAWAEDVHYFCRLLKLTKITILGVSGGGPYAVRCGYELAAECKEMILISSLAPLNVSEVWNTLSPRAQRLFRLADTTPWLAQIIVGAMLKLSNGRLEKIFEFLQIPLPDSDRRILGHPLVIEALKKDVAEAFRQGSRAVVDELRAQLQPWTIPLDGIRLPVSIWHGTADTIVPPAMATYLAAHIPSAQLHWVEGGGHFVALELVGKIFR